MHPLQGEFDAPDPSPWERRFCVRSERRCAPSVPGVDNPVEDEIVVPNSFEAAQRNRQEAVGAGKDRVSNAPAGSAALPDILRGYERFRQEQYPRLEALFRRLDGGQSPKVLFITCSDSRLDPCLFTQTLPGDLFVVRNAGNIVPEYREDSAEVATIEYAIKALRTPHVVVCGHSGCGAMAGLLDPGQLETLPAVRRWVAHSQLALERARAAGGEALPELVRQNVVLQLERLQAYPFISSALSNGAVRLHGWVYEIGSGAIVEYDPQRRAFCDLSSQVGAWA